MCKTYVLEYGVERRVLAALAYLGVIEVVEVLYFSTMRIFA